MEENSILNNTFTYSVDGLLKRSSIACQNRVDALIDGPVRVKGVVKRVYRSEKSNCSYVDIGDRGYSISLTCGIDEPVVEKQGVIAEGILALRPSKFCTGMMEAYLEGHIVGSWVPIKTSPSDVASLLPSKTHFVQLGQFFEEYSVESLLVLGTETAIGDIRASVNSGVTSNLRSRAIVVADKAKLLRELSSGFPPEVKALAFTRGGDDETLNLWNDPDVVSALMKLGLPYYTALGHSHSRTLADENADQYFPTPTALGAAINANLKRAKQMDWLKDKCQRLEQEVSQLTQQNSRTGREQFDAKSLGNLVRGILLGAGVAFVLVLVLTVLF